MYRRLLGFLRPHWWRMAGNVAFSIVAAGLDAFSFTLLIPFLNALFKQQQYITQHGWIADLQRRVVGAFLNPGDPLGSLGSMMIVIAVIVGVKNVFVWLSGQLG